jgi:tRNA dimethylallyltransferase
VRRVPGNLVVIAGPTAVGKSDLALRLAERHGGAILSADAMQVYRGFDVATSKPDSGARARVPHYLIDIADPRRDFSSGDFARAAEEALADARRRGLLPILAGGSGFYIGAFLRGLVDAPSRDERVRRRLRRIVARGGAGRLHRLLRRLDPDTAAHLPPADVQRVVRALEVRLATGRRLSDLVRRQGGPRGGAERYPTVKIGLHLERGALASRIEARVNAFFAAGLLREVQHLLDEGVPPEANAFKGIGYREGLAAVRGEITADEARVRTVSATRRYAKRQMTWFRGEAGVTWLDAGRGGDATLAAAEALLG